MLLVQLRGMAAHSLILSPRAVWCLKCRWKMQAPVALMFYVGGKQRGVGTPAVTKPWLALLHSDLNSDRPPFPFGPIAIVQSLHQISNPATVRMAEHNKVVLVPKCPLGRRYKRLLSTGPSISVFGHRVPSHRRSLDSRHRASSECGLAWYTAELGLAVGSRMASNCHRLAVISLLSCTGTNGVSRENRYSAHRQLCQTVQAHKAARAVQVRKKSAKWLHLASGTPFRN
ncbi:hypothetical protein V8F33_009465 [Rhypophila sp. PSN 637]